MVNVARRRQSLTEPDGRPTFDRNAEQLHQTIGFLLGAPIREDDSIIALVGSANRDSRQFPDGDRFDPDRDPTGHLAFGFGAHFCLGSALARMEAQYALESLVPLLPGLQRVEDDVEFIDSFLIRGPRRLVLARG